MNHYSTKFVRLKDFSVCGHSCGQNRFCAVFGKRKKSRKHRRRKALRRFALPCLGYRHGTPKPGAIPTSLYPDIQFLSLYHGGEENQRFFCLWSFLWSKPLLCRFLQSGKIQQTQVLQGFAAFCHDLTRIPPRHSKCGTVPTPPYPDRGGGTPPDYGRRTLTISDFLRSCKGEISRSERPSEPPHGR